VRHERRANRTVTSWEYIKDNFQPEDRLAVVVKRRHTAEVVQRIATASQLAGPRFQAWLRFENARGGDVYLGMNPLSLEARGRTKRDIAAVRHIFLDLDTGGPRALASILEDPRLPRPSYVLNTSRGKYQVVWKVAGAAVHEAERLQRAMARDHGADRAATDVTRVLRIPGLYNRKYDPPFQVTAERLSERIYDLAEFRIDTRAERIPEPARATVETRTRQGPPSISQSERDWAATLDRLGRGEEPASVQAWLEHKRQDKHDPAFYAALTVRKAVAELERRRAPAPVVELC